MILLEKHSPGKVSITEVSWKGIKKSDENWLGKSPCDCSYCDEYKLHYGLNIPQDWNAWNSWYVIKLGKGQYLRFTLPFLKIKKSI